MGAGVYDEVKCEHETSIEIIYVSNMLLFYFIFLAQVKEIWSYYVQEMELCVVFSLRKTVCLLL